ncbi:uncharacterized protein LOC106476278, partial [Limulus polyphemus]|uniref:Uncharacterized protein LOC106476278 n=1 Tax=Limulus polyphemus TaxID=6850 RepID=A0ABM1RX00_LIMPO
MCSFSCSCYKCGPKAICTVVNHEAKCICPPNTIGDPFDEFLGCYEEPPILEPKTPLPPTDLSVIFNRVVSDSPDIFPVLQVMFNGLVSDSPDTIFPVHQVMFNGLVSGSPNMIFPVPQVMFNGLVSDRPDIFPVPQVMFNGLVSDSPDTIFPVLQVILQGSLHTCGLIHVNGEASFILVIQKHPRLVTVRARAYHIKCVYNTGEKTITLGFNVSMITTSGTIANTGPPPTCKMTIVSNNGLEISSAEIGEDLLLRVDVQPDYIYGGFVRSCVAKTMNDDEEVQYEVTDDNGCATDPSIFGNWRYNPETKVLLATFNAFKFPASNNLRFQCNIRVCFGSCPAVYCDGVDAFGKRRKRQADEQQVFLGDSFREGELREEIQVQSNAILTLEPKEEKVTKPTE